MRRLYVGTNDPRWNDAVTCDDADQASAAVLAALFKKGRTAKIKRVRR
jgi:hypothetical protein